MKILKSKWVLFLLLIVCFVLVDLQIRNVSLAQRGIVLGIGIDKEGDEYIVTAEILSPSNLGAENFKKNRLVSIERGKSLEEAFEKMDKALGVRVSLRHTVLIVLGESMLLEGDYAPLIDLFVGNDVSDSTYIVGVDTSAKSLFKAKPPLYSTISYKISETFRSPDIESGMVTTNIKDFFKMYLSKSGGIYIPLVQVGKGNMSDSTSDKEVDSIEFGKIAILDKYGQQLILSEDESEGLSYIFSSVNEANIFVEGEDKSFDMDIIDTLCTRSLDTRRNCLTLDVKMWVKIGNIKTKDQSDYIGTFGRQEKELAGRMVAKSINMAYLACHRKGVDILGIASLYYKKLGKEYAKVLSNDYLNEVKVETKVTLIVK